MAARVWRDPVLWLAFGFGSGLAPVAPGTFGTLPGVVLAALLGLLAPAIGVPLWAVVLLALIVLTPIGIGLCGAASRRLGVHDHGGIVFDEIVGVLIPFLLVPVTPWTLLLAFLWFRLFDVVKPWPIRWLDRHVSGGWGIMVDDLLAGVFALAAVGLSVHFWPG
ncbi:phosphatidylglycerophosphatase [Halothiobacillus diazotrophicus]|uniref:Phosphatidylglycerophosphatase A n=1 Tax=Halothiobacillus diazotrophicus TaxID=1860122 RepID=A0A191ZJX3_9GAMM|nr:phosphatidylglycerophosphatase [Halothiobacillus diazotrophicus]